MTVYSANQFFNELDLLEIKLETLDPFVDFFIISEGTKTHSGLDKPLYYLENKDRYKKFHKKIIHQIIDDTPSSPQELFNMKEKNNFHSKVIGETFSANWFDKNIESYLRDTYEKECLILSMENCNPNDIILLGDLDEIVRPNTLKMVIDNFQQNKIYHFENEMFYYYFNCQKLNEPWFGTLALSFENYLNNSFCEMRTNKTGEFIKNGGWHFTSLGNSNVVKQKIESWGEQSLNTDYIKDNLKNSIENCLTNGHDLFFRPANFIVRDINDGTFPSFIVDNQDKFKEYIR
jgi:beta-1,4-mannosyl-glycoprotein beta-1,4-N-acetylglucosaminyltransferase